MISGRVYRVMAQAFAELTVTGLNAPDFISGGRDKSVLGGSLIVVVAQGLAHTHGTVAASFTDRMHPTFNGLDASHPSQHAT
jgi:hypothetical protein